MSYRGKVWLLVILLSIAGWWLIISIGRLAVELIKVVF